MAHYIIRVVKKSGNVDAGFVDHVEDGGTVIGEILNENREKLGWHASSTMDWLKHDLLGMVNFDTRIDSFDIEYIAMKMKPFDIKAAKNGVKVCTRDGRDVRILCFDRKGGNYPIIALVNTDGSEFMESYKTNGSCKDTGGSNFDLFLASTKREGWVNIYASGGMAAAGKIYDTKEKAQESNLSDALVDTIHIEWEE